MPGKVLIVDDEAQIREMLAEALAEAGYQTFVAQDGQEGLVQLGEHSPDVVVSDVWMPRIDGYHFCRMARRQSHAAIMVMSGVPSEAEVLQDIDVGADDVMLKPIELGEFVDKVKKLMEQAQAARENLPAIIQCAPDFAPTVEDRLMEILPDLSEDDRELLLMMAERLASEHPSQPS